jgi:hypothetical protein
LAPSLKHHQEEPSYIKEFKESNSVYHIPNKHEDSEISSDGEFNDANKMQVYREDDTEVYMIEQKQNYIIDQSENSLPQEVQQRFIEQKKSGALASRNQGLKHLNKVGYIGHEQRPVPRWASDAVYIKMILQHQNQKPNLAKEIFGKVTKKLVAEMNVQ